MVELTRMRVSCMVTGARVKLVEERMTNVARNVFLSYKWAVPGVPNTYIGSYCCHLDI